MVRRARLYSRVLPDSLNRTWGQDEQCPERKSSSGLDVRTRSAFRIAHSFPQARFAVRVAQVKVSEEHPSGRWMLPSPFSLAFHPRAQSQGRLEAVTQAKRFLFRISGIRSHVRPGVTPDAILGVVLKADIAD